MKARKVLYKNKNTSTEVQKKSKATLSIQPPIYGLDVIDRHLLQRKEVVQFGGSGSKVAVSGAKKVVPVVEAAVPKWHLDQLTLQLLLRERNYLTHGTNNEAVGTLQTSNKPQTGLARTNPAAESAVFALNDWQNTYGKYIIFYKKSGAWRANKHDPLTYLHSGELESDQAWGWAYRDDVAKASKANKKD